MFIYIILILLFLAIFLKFFIFKKRSEVAESVNEIEDYNEVATVYENEQIFNHKDEDELQEKDIKLKKTGYKRKNYRGTDIEVAGFESKKDLKKLQREEVLKVGAEELEKREEKPKIEIKIAQSKEMEIQRSGIAGKKAAMQKVAQEIKENYNAKGKVNALDNFKHSVKKIINTRER